MTFKEYFVAVIEAARQSGYKTNQIVKFRYDIYDCFIEGKSVDECVEEIFWEVNVW